MFNNYGPLCAEVYDLTKPIGSALNGDIDYYLDRLEGMTGPVLEAGVGTGRMLLPLLAAGHRVIGIDSSASMLAKCSLHCQDAGVDAELIHADLVDFSHEQRFSAIIIPTSTFCLIPTESQALKVLQNLYHHLATGGRLIMDLDLPFYPELGETTTTTHQIEPQIGITVENKTIEIDWLKQHIITYLTYQKWQDGQLVGTELQQLLLRWYGLSEFKLFLTAIGFKQITISADYEFNQAPTDSNQTITFEAVK